MLRYEIFLLLRGFEKDSGDPERVLHEDHLNFYYQKYFQKQMNPKAFGVADVKELLAFIQDTAVWSDERVLTTPLSEDTSLDMFVKLTEEGRRARQRRIDAGDETARLKFERSAMQQGSSRKPWGNKSSSHGQGGWQRGGRW